MRALIYDFALLYNVGVDDVRTMILVDEAGGMAAAYRAVTGVMNVRIGAALEQLIVLHNGSPDRTFETERIIHWMPLPSLDVNHWIAQENKRRDVQGKV